MAPWSSSRLSPGMDILVGRSVGSNAPPGHGFREFLSANDIKHYDFKQSSRVGFATQPMEAHPPDTSEREDGAQPIPHTVHLRFDRSGPSAACDSSHGRISRDSQRPTTSHLQPLGNRIRTLRARLEGRGAEASVSTDGFCIHRPDQRAHRHRRTYASPNRSPGCLIRADRFRMRTRPSRNAPAHAT